MLTTRAVVIDPKSPAHVRLGERPLRNAGPDEAIVAVRAFSLNRGELRYAAGKAHGDPIGWDVAGTIATPAATGGPAVGTPVVAFSRRSEGWAERVPIALEDLTVVPDGFDLEVAATLPVAGATALACLDLGTRLAGQRCLVTGATGGVGMFGVQLARAMGAHVVAQVRQPSQGAAVRELGAHAVVVTEDGAALAEHGPFRLAIDGVGGKLLGAAIAQLTPDGLAVSYGVTGDDSLALPIGVLIGNGRANIRGFNLFAESAHEPMSGFLSRLCRLVEDGALAPTISHSADWSELPAVAEAFFARKYPGKVVLRVSK